MLRFDQWFFPDSEAHLPARMTKWNLRIEGRLTYQYPLYQQGLKWCKGRQVAVDVGAHVGLFSYWMVRDFAQVVAFEPVASHRDCWRANVPSRAQDRLYPCALGAKVATVSMQAVKANSSGGTYVAGPGDIPMYPLDTYGLGKIDLLKIDCEGYELEVLEGARETVKQCRPVVVVEQRPKQVAQFGHGLDDAVRFVMKSGASIAWTDRRDYVLVFP